MDNKPESQSELEVAADPIALFEAWFKDARAKEPNDPDAVALATADARGRPNVRMVLLKHADRDGFVFYTNTESAKGDELQPTRRRPCAFTGSRWPPGARARACAAGERCRSGRLFRHTRAKTARSALGRLRNRAGSRGASRWRKRSRGMPPNSRWHRCRARRIGQAFACDRWQSSSGATGRSGCMTGWSTAVTH